MRIARCLGCGRAEFFEHGRRPTETLAFVAQSGVCRERGNEPRAFLLHRPRGRFVDQIAVFDAAHPRLHGARDGARRVGMRHDVEVRGLCLLDDRAQFFERVLRAVDRVGRARDAPARHHLDLVRAVAHLLAHRAAHFAHAVGDRAEQPEAGAGADHFACAFRANVGVASRLRDRPAGDEQARAVEQPPIHRLLQAEVGAARVAHAREAAQQHGFENTLALRRDQRGWLHRHAQRVVVHRRHVHMRVDQAGQDDPASSVDAGRIGEVARLLRHFDDALRPR